MELCSISRNVDRLSVTGALVSRQGLTNCKSKSLVSVDFRQALDADEGNNSRISYGILQSKDASEFSIDRETGWIKAKASFAGRLESEFIIGVIAKDRFGEEPYFNDTAEVKVRWL